MQLRTIMSANLDDSTEAGLSRAANAFNATTEFDKLAEKLQLQEKCPSDCPNAPGRTEQIAMAEEVVLRGNITLVPERRAFIVEGSKCKYCVTLYPKETCQCPATSTCYHILAARFSVGMTSVKSKGRPNAGRSCQKARKRAERGVLGKRSKRNDYADAAKSCDEKNEKAGQEGDRGDERPEDEQETNKKLVSQSVPQIDPPCPNLVSDAIYGCSLSSLAEDIQIAHTTSKRRKILSQLTNSPVELVYCICQKPDDGRRMAQCECCSQWFHEDCLSIPRGVFPKRGGEKPVDCYWECDDCWRCGVLHLGGSALDPSDGRPITRSNTCPLDSVLTIIHSYEKGQEGFLINIGDDPAGQSLKECLRLCRLGQYDTGKIGFINFAVMNADRATVDHITRFGPSKYDLFGDVRDVIFQLLSHVWSVEITNVCSSRNCSNPSQLLHQHLFTLSPKDDKKSDGSYDINRCLSRVGTPLDGACGLKTRSGMECQGVRQSNTGRFLSTCPWLIPLDLTQIGQFCEVNKLPDFFTFDRKRFCFGGVILYSAKSSHYETLVKRKHIWLHCDGFPGSTFQHVQDNDLEKNLELTKRVTLSTALYFIYRK